MSSPNHPTFDIENTFSSNSPNYTPTLPDYSPASLGNTPSESLNNSYGLVPIASPTLSLFHDDPYIKSYVDRMTPKRTSTSVAPAMTRAAIRQLVANSVFAALEAQATNMANADNTNRNPKPREAHPIGIEEAYKITWSEFKKLLIKKYCPRTEVKKMEDELYNLTVKGINLKTYDCPKVLKEMLPPQSLMDQILKHNLVQETNDHKQKFDDRRNTTTNNNYQNNSDNNYNNRNNDHHQQQDKRQEAVRAYAVNPTKNN
nr:reverse transcriptase domain-containing protein [Tanacetum cinerariifolium]